MNEQMNFSKELLKWLKLMIHTIKYCVCNSMEPCSNKIQTVLLKEKVILIIHSKELIALAITLAENLPTWSNKLVHVLIPEMEL